MLKKILSFFLPTKLKFLIIKIRNYYIDNYFFKSYSQEGEDMILRRIFENKQKGFYIDVGAHHPKRFSNTFYFYKIGWNGINIDAMPGSMKLFDKYRSRDINIEKPISEKSQVLSYYAFNEPALNGFSKELSKERSESNKNYHIIFEQNIETTTLTKVLEKNLPKNQEINFLTIDVEGLDFSVLKSIDLEKYRPKVILIEILSSNLDDIYSNEISIYLKKCNYIIHAKAIHSVIFIDKFFK
jgi:FkbM family methyltransferase